MTKFRGYFFTCNFGVKDHIIIFFLRKLVFKDLQMHQLLAHPNIPSQIFGGILVSLSKLKPFTLIAQNANNRVLKG